MDSSGPDKSRPITSLTELMRQRWTELAAAIARDAAADAQPLAAARGSLTVLGSGIAHPDLAIDTEQRIGNADHIFYSVNDHVTKAWINQLRPDAYDLSVLYSETIERHATYTRMAEALLHYVRRGRRVVAIFYGHPGIFAAPGHRAVQLARKEGHHARMRPGISALDSLIADIGFDPALPGMVMYEATDMLLRRRRLDPTLHVVIWQVGVTGEFGYNSRGYGNHGLNALVDALETVYGADWPIVHYVGAQYVGVEPRVETWTVGALREPRTARELSTLSTFYISPKDVLNTDHKVAAALGAAVGPNPKPQQPDYTGYGCQERETLRAFSDLQFAADYRIVEPNAVLAFLSTLSRDSELRDRFESEPRSVLTSPAAADLTSWEKSLMLTRSQKATVAAITGVAPPAAFHPTPAEPTASPSNADAPG